MTADLEQRLRQALHEGAERARLANPDRPPAVEALPLGIGHPRRRWPRRAVAVAAAVVLIAAAGVAVKQDRDQAGDVTTSPGPTTLFRDVPAGSTVELPPGPTSGREAPVVVWSGAEMIVWGGHENGGSIGDGSAFDPATGTWRVLAPAPIEARSFAQAAWTGTEMLVVGGLHRSGGRDEFLRDGAAYDPSTDTWRQLPEAPIGLGDGWVPVWTGDELVALGEGAAAYDPDTNEWRRLADPPDGHSAKMVWTGEVILLTVEADRGIEPRDPNVLVRYDPDVDGWQIVVAEGYTSLVAVPDGDGEVRSVLALPDDRGAPVAVLDRYGEVVGTLPGFPGDRARFGDRIYAVQVAAYMPGGTWIGDEALFWIRSAYSALETTPVPWTVNPATGTWRQLDADAPPPNAHLELVADAGVLVGWGPLSDAEGPSVGVIYRPPSPARNSAGQPEAEPPSSGAGQQPADPVAAEAQVRAAFSGIFDSTSSPETRAQFSERPKVWLSANQELMEGTFGQAVQDMRAEVVEVVFTSPTHATVTYQLIASDPVVPREQVGDAWLVDGRWHVAITTTCGLVSLAGVQCEMTL